MTPFSPLAAVKAKFVSYTTHKCRSAMNFTLEEQFDLKSKSGANCKGAPDIPSSFLVLGEHEDCQRKKEREEHGCFKSHETIKQENNEEKQFLTEGKSYLVSGTYYDDDSCGPSWEVTTKSLITLWTSKLTKKIDSWIDRGNSDRDC